MDLDKYLQNWSQLKFDKNSRLLFLALYALIMFSTIINELNLITFILIFAVAPISIYYFVKKIFPKEKR